MADKNLNTEKVKSSQGKNLLAVLFLVIGVTLYSQFIYKPLAARIKKFDFQAQKASVRLKELKDKFPQVNRQRQGLDSLDSDLQAINKEIQELEQVLPSKNNISQLLGEFTRLAQEVKLLSLRQKIDEGPEYCRIFVELNFNASYRDTINYINNIEALSPFLIVKELDISLPKKDAPPDRFPTKLLVSCLLADIPAKAPVKAVAAPQPLTPARNIFVSKLRIPSQSPALDFELEGITYNPTNPTAIIKGDVVRVGSEVGPFQVKQILPDTVVLTNGVTDYSLSIKR